jgi:hypothetical protein
MKALHFYGPAYDGVGQWGSVCDVRRGNSEYEWCGNFGRTGLVALLAVLVSTVVLFERSSVEFRVHLALRGESMFHVLTIVAEMIKMIMLMMYEVVDSPIIVCSRLAIDILYRPTHSNPSWSEA